MFLSDFFLTLTRKSSPSKVFVWLCDLCPLTRHNSSAADERALCPSISSVIRHHSQQITVTETCSTTVPLQRSHIYSDHQSERTRTRTSKHLSGATVLCSLVCHNPRSNLNPMDSPMLQSHSLCHLIPLLVFNNTA